jgi:hypothetical protein
MKDFYQLDIVNIYMFLELLTFFLKKINIWVIPVKQSDQTQYQIAFQAFPF